MYEKFGQFIDGKWQASSNKETYEVINPANEEVIGHASKATPEDVNRALKSAEKVFQLQVLSILQEHLVWLLLDQQFF